MRPEFDSDSRPLATALREADRLDQFGNTAVRRVIPESGADAGVLALLTEDDEELEVVASIGYPVEACMGPGRRWSAASSIPIAEAVRSNGPVVIGSPQEWAERYTMGYVPRSSSAAWAAFPVRQNGRAVGALLWTYYAPRGFDENEIEEMESVAALISHELPRLLA